MESSKEPIVLSSKIVSSAVKAEEKPSLMHEAIERPETLIGTTYKISPPDDISQHSLYITINDVLLNEGTASEQRHPYEVFINSKNMENFQWIVALTRILSAVFRKGGDIAFLVEELNSVFDPRGGYWKKGGIYMPSLVAEIGHVLERHLTEIGIIKHEVTYVNTEVPEDFPEHAQLCPKCNTKALVINDGCATCLACGDSKCS